MRTPSVHTHTPLPRKAPQSPGSARQLGTERAFWHHLHARPGAWGAAAETAQGSTPLCPALLLISSPKTAVCKRKAFGGTGQGVAAREQDRLQPLSGRCFRSRGQRKGAAELGGTTAGSLSSGCVSRQVCSGIAVPHPSLLSVTPGLLGRGCGSLMGKFRGTGGTIGKKLPVGNRAAHELCVCSAAWIYLAWGSALTQQLGSRPCSPVLHSAPGMCLLSTALPMYSAPQ